MKKSFLSFELIKILIAYFICYSVAFVLNVRLVRYDYVLVYLKNYRYIALALSILLIILFKLFNVSSKSILAFYGIIAFFLIFILINLDVFVSLTSTSNIIKFEILTILSCFITFPFITIIQTLVSYEVGYFSYFILPLYLCLMCFTSYALSKIKLRTKKIKKECK